MLGYGVQGRGQSLNMKDNGVNVIVGQREKTQELGPGRRRTAGCPARRCSRLEEAAKRGTIVQYLLSDAGQKEQWPQPQAAI